jgi:L-2-hydroxyglutarate oxidase
MGTTNTLQKYDLIVIGAGIIGLRSAITALESDPNVSILVVEKESFIGGHASGRNSGVLHAGFYYSPESLKARFCREGNLEIKRFAREQDIRINQCGKVVVTKNSAEDLRIKDLFHRGILNGVELELYSGQELGKFEPTAKTKDFFIWSPQTAILDPNELLLKLLDHYINLGGKIAFNTRTKLVRRNNEVVAFLNDKLVDAKKIVNAAGAFADEIGKQVGVGSKFASVPFKGSYRKSTNAAKSKVLIYPVPHPVNPFLGVHTTLTMEGTLKIGPTAMLALGRENYSGLKNLHLREVLEVFKSSGYVFRGTKHNLLEIMRDEIPLLSLRGLVREAGKISSEVGKVHSWKKPASGIRSQLVDIDSGELVQDFIVEEFENSLHFLNIVSPGWTSSFPFTQHFIDEFLKK